MPSKSLDGIKKLSGEELAKARKIVLDSIGETDKREKWEEEKNFSPPGRKMLDGIFSAPFRSVSKKIIIAKNEATKEKESPDKDLGIEYPKKEKKALVNPSLSRPVVFKESLESEIAEIEKVAGEEEAGIKKYPPAMHTQALPAGENKKARGWSLFGGRAGIFRSKQKSEAEKEKKIKEEMKKNELEEQKKKEASQKEEEKKRKEMEAQEREEKKAREKEEEARITAEKEKKKIRIKKREKKIRQKRKSQRRQARKIWFFETEKKLSGLVDGFEKSFRLAGKIMVFSALFLIVSAVLFYLIFAFLLLKFNLDNKVSRQIAGFMPVPAVITKIGFIGYYDYQTAMAELKKELGNGQELEQAAKVVFIEKISLARLAEKYNINFFGKGQKEMEKEINTKLAADKEANMVSYSRINKIKELVNAPQAGESFEEIGEKYGDEQGYVNENNEFLQLTEGVRQLESGQISDIIITDRGYYIVKREEDKLRYIFVKSVTLDEYFNKMLNGLKVWVLAD